MNTLYCDIVPRRIGRQDRANTLGGGAALRYCHELAQSIKMIHDFIHFTQEQGSK